VVSEAGDFPEVVLLAADSEAAGEEAGRGDGVEKPF
jgi:hypothetical protein